MDSFILICPLLNAHDSDGDPDGGDENELSAYVHDDE